MSASPEQPIHESLMIAPICFAGRVPYVDAPRLLQLEEVTVAPRVSATEGSGKILNYVAVGLPTVVVDTLVSYECLAELGYHARCGDAAALDDPPRARQVGTAWRARILQHDSLAQAAETMLAAYEGPGVQPRTPTRRSV